MKHGLKWKNIGYGLYYVTRNRLTIPLKLAALIDAPKLINSLITISCPFKQATCSGVLP